MAANMMTEDEQTELRRLIEQDPEAAGCFKALRGAADRASKEDPDPVPRIITEGRLRDDPERVVTEKSLRDMGKIGALGYAYAVSKDPAYANQARRYLLAWAGVNHSVGNPINDTNLEQPIVTYDVVRDSCSAQDRDAIDHWLLEAANAEIETASSPKMPAKNNWHTHRLKIVGLIGLALRDDRLTRYAIDGLRNHIDVNLDSDGAGLDFHERDALHYHLYTLQPMLALAIAARHIAPGLYGFESPRGCSIRMGVQFLLPFCDGRKTHAEFVKSRVAFDKKRAASGDPHYTAGRLFEPKEGATVLTLASYFDPRLGPLALKLTSESAKRFASWDSVLIAALDRPSQ